MVLSRVLGFDKCHLQLYLYHLESPWKEDTVHVNFHVPAVYHYCIRLC